MTDENEKHESYSEKDTDDIMEHKTLGNNADKYESDKELDVAKEATESNENKPQPSPAKKPVWWCQKVTEYPAITFGVTLGGHIFMLLLSGILLMAGYDLLPINFTSVPMDLTEDDTFLRDLAWNNRDSISNLYDRKRSQTSGSRTSWYDRLTVIFYHENGNVFTKENFKLIESVEEELRYAKDYTKYCLLDVDGNCTQINSILRYFDGTYASTNSDLNDPDYDNIPQTLETVQGIPTLAAGLQFFLGKNYVIDGLKNTASSDITRISIDFGSPLEDGGDIDKIIQEHQFDSYAGFLKDHFENGLGSMEVSYQSESLFTYEINLQVIKDMSLVIGSFVFIYIFMVIQVGSFWITSFSIMSVFTSFLGANIIYRVIFDYRYFGIFHVLAIFIILGIGADDVFVLMDTWKQTKYQSYPTLAHRLSDTYRRAASAMFVTSLTTGLAFFTNFFSPFLSISSFGIFSALVIFVNYLSVIIFLPTVVVTYHLWWAKYCCCCCNRQDVALQGATSQENLVEESVPKEGIFERFFGGRFADFVMHKVFRWIILLAFLAFVAGFGYLATTLETQQDGTVLLKDTHVLEISRYRNRNLFVPSDEDENTLVILAWGLKNQDLSSCHFTDDTCAGQLVQDEEFDLSSAANQQAFLEFCEKLKDLDTKMVEDLAIKTNSITENISVNCFIENMKTYYENNGKLSFPLIHTEVEEFMTNNSNIYDMSTVPANFMNTFDVGLAYWLTNGHVPSPGEQFFDFIEYIGEVTDDNTFQLSKNASYQEKSGTHLGYAAITVETTLVFGTVGPTLVNPIAERWEEFMKTEMAKMPSGVNRGFQCTPPPDGDSGMWHWMKVQDELANSAVRGIMIGLLVALCVLVTTTVNLVIGTLATIIISLITVSVVGVIPLAGWQLGPLESLNLSLVVGLAVDYVVHLAEAYHVSDKRDRRGRTREMLRRVGISVISGATTTLGASFFMLLAKITFFMQFGIFMFCTIGFSMAFSLGLFSTVMALIGPEDDFGSLLPPIKWCKSKCSKSSVHPVID
ncbi:protein dispatched homolog 1-like [Antedon mediterranea]|uniref:protein dispatched homolog 1-like n=1 Tax=Antedon mediterranea TaxID=105859 RepID=UPI003AF7283A